MEDQARYEEAKKRVHEIKGFYHHLAIYLLINILLLGINMLTSPQRLWFYWPLLGWGVAVVLHAIAVFGSGMFLGKDWEERKIKELLDKEKRQ